MDKLKKVKEALEDLRGGIFPSVDSVNECIDKALAELNAFMESTGWQPIETAPQEKEVMVCYRTHIGAKYGWQLAVYRPEHYIEHGDAQPEGWYTGLGVDDYEIFEQPTHWMPKPPPPD